MRPRIGRAFKGVRYDPRYNRWYGHITIDGRQYGLGGYPTPEGAAKAYDRAAFDAWGEFARLNLPDQFTFPQVE
jgi:hypothetical protein